MIMNIFTTKIKWMATLLFLQTAIFNHGEQGVTEEKKEFESWEAKEGVTTSYLHLSIQECVLWTQLCQ